ncbi:MAG: hypothetical protein MKZ98_05105, partial [Pseudomonadales bacterium]|nr:hypothetical protein [Pseudomonadales bacterium]
QVIHYQEDGHHGVVTLIRVKAHNFQTHFASFHHPDSKVDALVIQLIHCRFGKPGYCVDQPVHGFARIAAEDDRFHAFFDAIVVDMFALGWGRGCRRFEIEVSRRIVRGIFFFDTDLPANDTLRTVVGRTDKVEHQTFADDNLVIDDVKAGISPGFWMISNGDGIETHGGYSFVRVSG